MPNDDDLRARFSELRSEDEASVSQFHSFLRRAVPRRASIRVSAWAVVMVSMAVLIAVIVVAVQRSGQRNTGRPAVSITEWKSSTDFLLRTPGQEVLRTIPRIGPWPVSNRIPAGDQKSPPARKKSLTKTPSEENPS